ncbi:hypothetical protein [Paenibacillus sp. Soil787]|uniref:hypothetical protein n=1 Tax=Paenibacillus sp. Soil787 TaxID=1736411 RepID=UPI0006F42095|nr:hypothetical protein [Paenibacillus sp. Soil787]KRF42997.1 hypothetical protein ASG93_20825 [Paenibacillus sp. Soil787]
MNRYAFYVIWCNTLTIHVLFVVPYLLEIRFSGSIMAVALCTIPGSIFLVSIIKSLGYFPNQGLPEIFRMFMPAWARVPFLLFFSVMIVAKACLILGYAAFVINQYLLPQTSSFPFIAFFFLAVAWGATRSSKTVLSTLELVILMTTPFIYFVFTKSIFSRGFEWNAIKAMYDYAFVLPKWQDVTIANTVFSGFVVLTIFNRMIPSKINGKFYALILIVSLHLIFIQFMIPIGFHGTSGVGNFLNPTLTAIDAMSLELGIFERGLLLYLLAFLFLNVMEATITLHVGVELLKGCFSMESLNKPRKNQLISWITISLYAVLTMLIFYFFTIKEILRYAINFLELRFYTELLLVVLVAVFARMKRRRSI